MTDCTALNTTDAAAVPVAVLIDRKALVAALAYLAGSIVEARNTIPIVSCVTIDACEAGARLTATDLDIYASCDIAAAWDAPGAIVADVRALLAAVRGCDGDTVKLAATDASVIVSGDGLASTVPARDRADFPTPKPMDSASFFVLNAPQLANDWRRASASISSEETRYYLNGIFMHARAAATEDGERTLAFASTDGHRMTRIVRPMPSMLDGDLPDTIIPRKTVAAVLKALGNKPGASDLVGLHVTATRIRIVAGAWTLDSKVIDGTFPDYSRVIPTHNTLRATFDAAALGKVASGIAKAQGKDCKAVRLSLDATAGASLSSTTAEGAATAGAVGASWRDLGGEDGNAPAAAFSMGFNARYLAAVCDAFGAGDLVGDIADAAAPVLWSAPASPEMIVVLMPMRVDGGTAAPKVERASSIQPVETPLDVFERDYSAAFVAGDGAAMRAAIAALDASSDAHAADVRHDRLAMRCASLRRTALEKSDPFTRQASREDARIRRGVARVGVGRRRHYYRGSFKSLGAREKARAAVRDMLTQLEGFQADDARAVVPVILDDGSKAFVRLADLSNVESTGCDLVKADGTLKRSRRTGAYVGRGRIVRVVQPVKRRAAATVGDVAPDAAVVALQAQVDALAAQVAALLERAAETPAPVAVEPAPIAAEPVDGTDARDAYIATLLTEREAARDRVEALEAMNADLQRIAERETARADTAEAIEHRRAVELAGYQVADMVRQDSRRRTAKRLVTARAAARTARREAIGEATARRMADTELARLQPLAAALQALMPAPAPVTGGNVVPLHAAA